jgi:hypothetical protein
VVIYSRWQAVGICGKQGGQGCDLDPARRERSLGAANRESAGVPANAFRPRSPMISPEGRWLAYMSNESGTYRVYVQAFPQGGGQRQVSDDGGTYPAWWRNGHEIFFGQFDEHRPRRQLMVASYQARGDWFVADTPPSAGSLASALRGAMTRRRMASASSRSCRATLRKSDRTT